MAAEVKKVKIPVVLTDLIELRDEVAKYKEEYDNLPFEFRDSIRRLLLNMDYER